ncbi:MAG: PEP-CTERM-box response regulator transcription factor [Verrucomicrobiales bacterium]|nr:PEP-CTERM-box response regulator transcription factor [Nitrospinaceae bacterium]
MSKSKILIVDDDEAIRTQLKWALAEEYEVSLAGDGAEALLHFNKERPPLVALDLGLPPAPREATEGLKVLEKILEVMPETKVIIISGNMDKANPVKAIALGAYDFFSKPVELDELQIILRRALQLYELERQNKSLQKRLADEPFSEMVGQSEAILDIFTTIRKVATTDAPVLILGESGTGKELISRAIHQKSHRRRKPFIVINCGAIPGELLESELFGHEKGAFTGANALKKGKFEYADGGTLLLDEIGDMPLLLQVKLLRFLQDFKIERVGGKEGIKIDVRVLAATNTDLKKAISEGKFREDLYYRLDVVKIVVPPLRERGSDIELLCNIFLQQYRKAYKKKVKGFSPEAYESLCAYNWPGNVRELENKVKRAIIMTEDIYITPQDLGFPPALSLNTKYQTLKAVREHAEREHILKALARNRGSMTSTAKALGVTRPTLYEVMERLGIEK